MLLPTAALSCYVSVGILQRLLGIFCSFALCVWSLWCWHHHQNRFMALFPGPPG